MSDRRNIQELLARFPVNASDQTWNAEVVLSEAFHSASRIFDKHVKGRLPKPKKLTNNA